MKSLFLVRHAKSSWDDAALPDRDRPLQHRGERDLAMMSKRLSQRHVQPDLIMSSPALRARATAKGIVCKPERIVVNDRLYAATADDLIAVIEELDDRLRCVMLIGHNPEITDLARHFSSRINHMSTCAVAEFRFDVKKWKGVGRTRPVRSSFDSPKGGSD